MEGTFNHGPSRELLNVNPSKTCGTEKKKGGRKKIHNLTRSKNGINFLEEKGTREMSPRHSSHHPEKYQECRDDAVDAEPC